MSERGSTAPVPGAWPTYKRLIGYLGPHRGMFMLGMLGAVVGTRSAPTLTRVRSEGRLGTTLRLAWRSRPYRVLLTGFVVQALGIGVMLAGTDYVAAGPLDDAGATSLLFVCFVGPALVVMPVYAGDLEAGQAAMAPFRSIATPIADLVGPMPYTGMYELTAQAATPSAEVFRSTFLAGLDLDAAEALVDHHRSPASRVRAIGFPGWFSHGPCTDRERATMTMCPVGGPPGPPTALTR